MKKVYTYEVNRRFKDRSLGNELGLALKNIQNNKANTVIQIDKVKDIYGKDAYIIIYEEDTEE